MLERTHSSLSLTWSAVIGKCTELVASFFTVYSSGFASTEGLYFAVVDLVHGGWYFQSEPECKQIASMMMISYR
jgi:hypothetical protein